MRSDDSHRRAVETGVTRIQLHRCSLPTHAVHGAWQKRFPMLLSTPRFVNALSSAGNETSLGRFR
jgi:hypothetical protein